jgi:hypothetical protein
MRTILTKAETPILASRKQTNKTEEEEVKKLFRMLDTPVPIRTLELSNIKP